MKMTVVNRKAGFYTIILLIIKVCVCSTPVHANQVDEALKEYVEAKNKEAELKKNYFEKLKEVEKLYEDTLNLDANWKEQQAERFRMADAAIKRREEIRDHYYKLNESIRSSINDMMSERKNLLKRPEEMQVEILKIKREMREMISDPRYKSRTRTDTRLMTEYNKKNRDMRELEADKEALEKQIAPQLQVIEKKLTEKRKEASSSSRLALYPLKLLNLCIFFPDLF